MVMGSGAESAKGAMLEQRSRANSKTARETCCERTIAERPRPLAVQPSPPVDVAFLRGKRNALDPRQRPHRVLSEAQARILRWLGGFPASMEEAWDVPRELSLPGIAEALGVVRSALNPPMEGLVGDGLVWVRDAHVIGGGARRRRVHHLTEAGRAAYDRLDDGHGQPRSKAGRWTGTPPSARAAIGRQAEVEALEAALSEHGLVVLTGLAGIGKSTVAELLAATHVEQGGHVHWANVGAYDGPAEVLEGLDGGPFGSDQAAIAMLEGLDAKWLLIVDGLEQVHPSHHDAIWSMLNTEGSARKLAVGRAPLHAPDGVTKQILEPLSEEEACRLLGRDDADARRIVQRLEGHPLALQLHTDGMNLDQAPADVTRFVLDAVLAGVEGEERDSLDELALLPMPVPAQALRVEGVDDLDERALLRWSAENDLRLHALVHHVHREGLVGDDLIELAALGATHWEGVAHPLAPLMVLHHRLLVDARGLADVAEAVMAAEETGALGRLSAVLEDALRAAEKEERDRLHGLAADVAVRRGEVERARAHLSEMQDPDLVVQAAVLRLEGEVEQADAVLLHALGGAQNLRARIALITAAIEDRLPEDENVSEPLRLLEEVDPAALEIQERGTAVVVLATLRCSLLVLAGRVEEATELVAHLEQSGTMDAGMLADLRWRIALRADPLDRRLMDGLNDHLEGREDLRALGLRLSLLERQILQDHEGANEVLSGIPEVQGNGMAQRRLRARKATCLCRLAEGHAKRPATLQAAALHRHAGSLRASQRLLEDATGRR